MKNYVCSICGMEYFSLDEYLSCVSKCGNDLKEKQKAEAEKERLEKLNAALNAVKQAKKYYEEQLTKFKEEYPTEYELNFGKTEDHKCKCSEKSESKYVKNTCDSKTKTDKIEISYEENGKDKPKMTAIINGKDVTGEAIDTLLKDPECRHIVELLGLL